MQVFPRVAGAVDGTSQIVVQAGYVVLGVLGCLLLRHTVDDPYLQGVGVCGRDLTHGDNLA